MCSVSSWISFGTYIFLGICPFHAWSCSYYHFIISLMLAVKSPFYSSRCLVATAVFFLINFAKDVTILLVFPNNQILFLFIFFIQCLFSITIISAQVFIFSFLPNSLGLLCCSFPICQGWRYHSLTFNLFLLWYNH